jgi:hypothetical protein
MASGWLLASCRGGAIPNHPQMNMGTSGVHEVIGRGYLLRFEGPLRPQPAPPSRQHNAYHDNAKHPYQLLHPGVIPHPTAPPQMVDITPHQIFRTSITRFDPIGRANDPPRSIVSIYVRRYTPPVSGAEHGNRCLTDARHQSNRLVVLLITRPSGSSWSPDDTRKLSS